MAKSWATPKPDLQVLATALSGLPTRAADVSLRHDARRPSARGAKPLMKLQMDWQMERGIASHTNFGVLLIVLGWTGALSFDGISLRSPEHTRAILKLCLVLIVFLWACFAIAFIGIPRSGKIALWRKSLIPGMIAHGAGDGLVAFTTFSNTCDHCRIRAAQLDTVTVAE